MNESAPLSAARLVTPGLWTGRITVNQDAALQTHVGRQVHKHTVPFFYVLQPRFVFPSIQTNEMAGMFITLCEPSLAACLVSFLT